MAGGPSRQTFPWGEAAGPSPLSLLCTGPRGTEGRGGHRVFSHLETISGQQALEQSPAGAHETGAGGVGLQGEHPAGRGREPAPVPRPSPTPTTTITGGDPERGEKMLQNPGSVWVEKPSKGDEEKRWQKKLRRAAGCQFWVWGLLAGGWGGGLRTQTLSQSLGHRHRWVWSLISES